MSMRGDVPHDAAHARGPTRTVISTGASSAGAMAVDASMEREA
jgi:hypothetical protein